MHAYLPSAFHQKFPTFRLNDCFAVLQIDSAALHRFRRDEVIAPYQCGDRGGITAYDRFTVSLSTFLSSSAHGLKWLTSGCLDYGESRAHRLVDFAGCDSVKFSDITTQQRHLSANGRHPRLHAVDIKFRQSLFVCHRLRFAVDGRALCS